MGRPKKKQSEETDRSMNWAFLFYTEFNDPIVLRSSIADLMINAYISPYHQHDLNPDGETKKAHYHVMLMYPSMKSPEQVIEDARLICETGLAGCNILDPLASDYDFSVKPDHYVYIEHSKAYVFYADKDEKKCIGAILRVTNKSGMARYFLHADHPDKYQYSRSDIIEIGNVDYDKDYGRTYDKYECIHEMCDFVLENQIYFYSDLLMYAYANRPNDWHRVLCDSGSYVLDMYIKSLTFKQRRLKAIMKGKIEPDDI